MAMAAIPAIAAIGGAMIGNQQASANRTAAENARRQAIEQFMRIQIPDIEAQKIDPRLMEYIGNYQAGQEGAIGMNPSSMEGVSTDPRLADAQMSALDLLSQMGETGLLPGEEAALRQSRRGSAQEAQAKSAQLLDEFARRGMGGSGAELASRLQASQSSADRMSQESDRILQMAQERALSAIGQQGNLAGQIRNQSFGEQSDVARAQDAINQFNTANQQNVQQRNVASTNQANQRNLGEQQRIAEGRTAQQNMADQYNKELQQQQFGNRMNLAAGRAGQFTGSADAASKQAGQTADMWAGIGRGVGTGVAAYNQQPAAKPTGFTKQEEDDFLNYGKY